VIVLTYARGGHFLTAPPLVKMLDYALCEYISPAQSPRLGEAHRPGSNYNASILKSDDVDWFNLRRLNQSSGKEVI
jgi:hypothetical protein